MPDTIVFPLTEVLNCIGRVDSIAVRFVDLLDRGGRLRHGDYVDLSQIVGDLHRFGDWTVAVGLMHQQNVQPIHFFLNDLRSYFVALEHDDAATAEDCCIHFPLAFDAFKCIARSARARLLIRSLESPAQRMSDANVSIDAAEIRHSADFTMVHWYGTDYTFALGVQSSAVEALWVEFEKSGLGLHQDTIRNTIDAERDTFRMDKSFRNHPAMGTMIQSAGDGKYKLVKPSKDNSAGIPSKARRTPR